MESLMPPAQTKAKPKLKDPKKKGLSDEASEHARLFLRRLCEEGFEGNVLAFSRSIGISQSHLHNVIHGKVRPGSTLLEKMADYAKVSIDVILGKAPAGGDSADFEDVYPNRAKLRGTDIFKAAPPEVQSELISMRLNTGDRSYGWWVSEFGRLLDLKQN